MQIFKLLIKKYNGVLSYLVLETFNKRVIFVATRMQYLLQR